MNIILKSFAFGVLPLSLLFCTPAISAPLKSDTVTKNFIRQCQYVDGVTVRVLASRECPVLEIAVPTPPTKTTEVQQTTQVSNARASEDVVLDKAISRCLSIGFVRDTSEFRTCVTDQITLLSK